MILKRFRLVTLCFLVFSILVSSPTLLAVAQCGDHHDDHVNDPTDTFPNDYAPMVIPFNDKKVTVTPSITCAALEDVVFKPYHHPCKLAQTLLVDDEWSDKNASYIYLFEDWTDYDWNDIVVSLYAATNDVIDVEIYLEDREAAWKNPFSVEITPESLTVDVHWNSTDYSDDHVVRVNPNEIVDIELFAESNPGDTALITITPVIPPTYTLTITSTSGGTTNPTPGNNTYPEDTLVTVTATPFTDYVFDHWELDSESVGSDNPTNVTMNDDHTLEAVFTRITYTLTITTTTGGTTSPASGDHVYYSGTNVPVTATPQNGYQFDHWVLDGSNASSDNLLYVTMDEDHTLHAVFKEVPLPSPPVGGHAIPIDKTHFPYPKIDLIPGIDLAFVLLAAMAVTIILIRRRNKTLKWGH